ncbi:MAG: ParB N-terminal domain-containing protein [Chloroflexi bacterium]|nr:ParB N-terminal domain-containing protein [Chloroflexota bacterium]
MAAIMAAEQVLAVFKRQNVAETLALRVVAVEQVRPHEAYHPARVEKLAARILADGLLVNPPVAVALEDQEHYVVLDGATRVTAFQQLGYPHIVLQVVDLHRDNVQLHTWFHAVHGGSSKDLLAIVRGLKGLRVTEMPVDNLAHALWERNALAYLVTLDKQGFLLEFDALQAEDGHDGLDVLRDFVECYGAWGDIERTLVTDVDQLRAQFPDLAGLVVFPQFAPEIVLQMAAKQRLLPAGITRFVIPGRILRLNAPLTHLASNDSIAKKREWLDNLVQAKLTARAMRYYTEPVVLLDE